jgi:glyoxylase-like metal-dependent hydrolase (beta-lactamase superfamily II)
MKMKLGSNEFEVRFTPGHTPGHCVLVCADTRAERSEPTGERRRSEGVCFCGDLIFAGSVGRTDLPGGDFETLEKSIREQIYTLPDEMRLLSGHGPETTVGREKRGNPWVRGET